MCWFIPLIQDYRFLVVVTPGPSVLSLINYSITTLLTRRSSIITFDYLTYGYVAVSLIPQPLVERYASFSIVYDYLIQHVSTTTLTTV